MPLKLARYIVKPNYKRYAEFCDAHNLWLYLDGARLATGLMSDNSDLTIEDIAHLTDAFLYWRHENWCYVSRSISDLSSCIKF